MYMLLRFPMSIDLGVPIVHPGAKCMAELLSAAPLPLIIVVPTAHLSAPRLRLGTPKLQDLEYLLTSVSILLETLMVPYFVPWAPFMDLMAMAFAALLPAMETPGVLGPFYGPIVLDVPDGRS